MIFTALEPKVTRNGPRAFSKSTNPDNNIKAVAILDSILFVNNKSNAYKLAVQKKENILYKCGWSPFEGQTFNSQITHTFVSGHLAYENGVFNENKLGERLTFNR